MADIKNPSKAGERFAALVKKHRGGLTKEERKVLALQKNVADARYAWAKQEAAMIAASKKAAELQASAVKAKKDFEAAIAALEAK